MKKMILASSLLLITAQMGASQRTLTSGTQTSSGRDSSESDDESNTESLSSLSQAYLTARTSPIIFPLTTSSGTQTRIKMITSSTQTDDLVTAPANPLPSAPPEELLQNQTPTFHLSDGATQTDNQEELFQRKPEYLDEETQTDKKTDEQSALALLADASKQYTFGVHDKVAAALLAVVGLKFLAANPFLAERFLTFEGFSATAVLSAATYIVMEDRKANYFWADYLPTTVTSGIATVIGCLAPNGSSKKIMGLFAIGGIAGTAFYNSLQWWKTPYSEQDRINTQRQRALRN